jgi:hypothetical protein
MQEKRWINRKVELESVTDEGAPPAFANIPNIIHDGW